MFLQVKVAIGLRVMDERNQGPTQRSDKTRDFVANGMKNAKSQT